MLRDRRTFTSVGLAAATLGLFFVCLWAVGQAAPRAIAQGAQPAPRAAKGLEIIGHNDLGQPIGNTSEVWYAKGTAYVGYRCAHRTNPDAKGTSFVDVRDPANPTVLFSTPPVSGTFADDVWGLPNLNTVSFKGDLLVEPHDWCSRVVSATTRFWDVTDPAKPKLLSTLVTGDGVHNVYPFTRMENGEQKAYVILAAPFADTNDNTLNGYEDIDLDADFAIVDATDPRNPQIISKWNAHQAYPNLPASTFQHDTWANKAGTMAYGAYWDAGMIILDISDIRNIKPISKTGYSDVSEGNTHGVVLSKNEDYAVVTDEDFDPSASEFRVLEPTALAGVKRSTVGAFGKPTIEGETVWVGRGCDADPAYMLTAPDPYLNDPKGKIAVIVRGGCTFAGKVEEAQKHGATGAIIVNNVDDGTPSGMGGGPRAGTTIPGVGINLADGAAITKTLEMGTAVKVRFGEMGGEWGYTRIFDIKDPAKPKQVSEYTIAETRAFPQPTDQSFGFSVHNAYVVGDDTYIAHYDGGVRILDIADPTKPFESAFLQPPNAKRADGTEVRSSIWGIITDEHDNIYASDINGGLWILRKVVEVNVPTTVPPTAVPPTAAPPTAVPPTAVPPTPVFSGKVCPQIVNLVPMAVINQALANPNQVTGYNQLADLGKPEGPTNPRRTWVSLQNLAVPFHPTYNTVVYRASCP